MHRPSERNFRDPDPEARRFIAFGNWTAREIGLEAFPPKA